MEIIRKNPSFTSSILTNDPSITAWGYAILDKNEKIIDVGCIKTSPQHKKSRIRKGDDTIRRVSEINNVLKDIINKYNVKLILSELPHGSQNASAAVMIGIVTGIIQTISDFTNIPVEWFSEQDAKKAVLRKNSATKDEMIRAINDLYEVSWLMVKFKDEAIADALAIHYVASKQSSTLKLLKNK